MANIYRYLTQVLIALFVVSSLFGQEVREWNGLVVAPEERCAPYDRDEYPYPQSVEPQIIDSLGGRIYGPYTGRHFESRFDTQIEHIVAISEAHDSGACAWPSSHKRAFARDLGNLTLASQSTNVKKGGRDPAQWLPKLNVCWFAARVITVKREYGLTVDSDEVDVLQQQLSECESTQMEVYSDTGDLDTTLHYVQPHRRFMTVAEVTAHCVFRLEATYPEPSSHYLWIWPLRRMEWYVCLQVGLAAPRNARPDHD